MREKHGKTTGPAPACGERGGQRAGLARNPEPAPQGGALVKNSVFLLFKFQCLECFPEHFQ